MNKVQTKHLLNVARVLREAHAAKKKFTMEKFVFGGEEYIESNYDSETCDYKYLNQEENFCGTPACALGHYGARTDVRRLLKVAILKDDNKVKYAELQMFGSGDGIDFYDQRIQDHFGLDADQLDTLFGADGCGNARTALQAAKFIENFVNKQQFPRTPRS